MTKSSIELLAVHRKSAIDVAIQMIIDILEKCDTIMDDMVAEKLNEIVDLLKDIE